MTTKEIGNLGEEYAAKFLEEGGIRVLKRNYYCRAGEIDIIAEDGETIVFVEVKTRATKSFGTPGEFVNKRKQERIIKTALYYLGSDDIDMRFDVVEVIYARFGGEMTVTEINHIKAAF